MPELDDRRPTAKHSEHPNYFTRVQGFLALSGAVQFLYKCSDFYSPTDERGIAWNDPGLNISWGFAAPIISARDSVLPTLAHVPREFLPEHPVK